jgi:formylmethanofuran dehydrogenase subunit B
MVMRWNTGYPFGVNLSRGYPRFNPGEYSTIDLLVRGDTDATLVLGADPGATMPQPAIEHLARTPTIVLDPKVTHTSKLARVHNTTAATGVSAPGTVYRMDEVPMPLRPALKSPYPTDEEVVLKIIEAVNRKAPFAPRAESMMRTV